MLSPLLALPYGLYHHLKQQLPLHVTRIVILSYQNQRKCQRIPTTTPDTSGFDYQLEVNNYSLTWRSQMGEKVKSIALIGKFRFCIRFTKCKRM